MGCRIDKANEWKIRCIHESMMHEHNAFITLTYAPENKPADLSLDHQHWRQFYFRLYNHLRPASIKPRYYMCGEYGKTGENPHYHALIFGFDFPDRYLWRDGPAKLYRSPLLELLWPHGFSTIGEVTPETAGYVAGYIRKKLKGKMANTPNEKGLKAYELYNDKTGEIIQRKPEYAQMSRRPGIGATFYEKYGNQIRNHDNTVVESRVMRVPKYYDRITEKLFSDTYARNKERRINRARKLARVNTPERLRAKEAFKQAVVNKSHRESTL